MEPPHPVSLNSLVTSSAAQDGPLPSPVHFTPESVGDSLPRERERKEESSSGPTPKLSSQLSPYSPSRRNKWRERVLYWWGFSWKETSGVKQKHFSTSSTLHIRIKNSRLSMQYRKDFVDPKREIHMSDREGRMLENGKIKCCGVELGKSVKKT